jgi:GxxExxY protein
MNKKQLNFLTYTIIGAAIEVHKNLGPGLLESIYHQCMIKELNIRQVKFETELSIPVVYKSEKIESNLRCDLFVERTIVVELKSVDVIDPIHQAQILTYMQLLKSPKGIIINFNCVNLFKHGQKTLVNDLFRSLPYDE